MQYKELEGGAYGKIYKINDKVVKINSIDTTIDGIGNSIKELDILSKLKGHPYVIDLISISFGEIPFNLQIEENDSINSKNDTLYFVFEYVPIKLSEFIKNKKYTFEINNNICSQILLGIEFIHSKNITHRDLKPQNIMLKESNGQFQIKIIDFGMSQILIESSPSSPGVSTSWYRAPEICCKYINYDKKSDMWSVGCIIYEIFSKKALLYECSKDNDSSLINKILQLLPIIPDNIEELIPKKYLSNIKCDIKRKKFIDLITNSEIKKKIDNIDILEDLLENLINLDHDKRFNSSKALCHPFFKDNFEFIKTFKQTYEIKDNYMQIIKIQNCIEHRWIIDLSKIINDNKKNLSWFSYRILFHAIDLFDRYLEYLFINNKFNENFEETDKCGKFLSDEDSIFHFYVCIYLFYKYYSTLKYCDKFEKICPENFKYDLTILHNFEIFLIKDVCNYELYRETLLEILPQYNENINKQLINNLLLKYFNVIEWQNGSVRSLYKTIYKINK
jgi:serine/threonine protein kinase